MNNRVTQHSIPTRPFALHGWDSFYKPKGILRSAALGYYVLLAIVLLAALALFYAGQSLRQNAYDRGAAEAELKAVQLTRLQQQQYFNYGRQQGFQEGYKAALTGGLEKGVRK